MKWSLQIVEYWVGLHWVPFSGSLETALIESFRVRQWETGTDAIKNKHTGGCKNSVLRL